MARGYNIDLGHQDNKRETIFSSIKSMPRKYTKSRKIKSRTEKWFSDALLIIHSYANLVVVTWFLHSPNPQLL